MDKGLLYITICLLLLGLVALYSASAPVALDEFGLAEYYVIRQGLFIGVGTVVMLVMARIPYYFWARWARPIGVAVLILLTFTLMQGVEANGAERWLSIGGFQFQPSEAGKIAVLLLLAQGLAQRNKPHKTLDFWINLGLIGGIIGLILKQPNLSMTIILSVVSVCLMFIAQLPTFVLGFGVVGGVAFAIHKVLNTPYQLRRINGWLDPFKDAQDTGFQLVQSLYAIGSGGVFGRGLGMSHQKLFWLPFPYTDFIFSVWLEEWGLVGGLLLMGLFITLFTRGFVIAKGCRSPFGQYLAMGIVLMLAVQTFINIAVASGFFPVTGVTLPLFSYGGTSIVVTMAMIGLLLNISTFRMEPVRSGNSHG